MNNKDLNTAAALLRRASAVPPARDLSANLRAMGLVRTEQWYRKKGEGALMDAWLRAAGLPHGQRITTLDRRRSLHLHRRAFGLAEALHLLAQAKREESR